MEKEEEKEEIEEESEDEEEREDKEKLKDTKLSDIVIDASDGLKSIKFNKEKCVKNSLLEVSEKELYTNLYPIKFTKDIEVYEYPFIIKPECHEESVILKILRQASPYLFKTYGYYYRSGNSLFALKYYKHDKFFKEVIHHFGWIEYTITVKAPSRGTVIETGKKKILKNLKKKFYF